MVQILKMRKTFNLSLRASLLSTLLLVLIVSCSNPDTRGVIRVLNIENENPVPQAEVKLYMDTQEPNAGFFPCDEILVTEKTYTTDGSGRVDICFKLPSVIEVEVTHPSGAIGAGRLSLQEGETTNLTIYISGGTLNN